MIRDRLQFQSAVRVYAFFSCAFGVFNNIICSNAGYGTFAKRLERADVILSDFHSFNANIIYKMMKEEEQNEKEGILHVLHACTPQQ